jgi:hypothetical protein
MVNNLIVEAHGWPKMAVIAKVMDSIMMLGMFIVLYKLWLTLFHSFQEEYSDSAMKKYRLFLYGMDSILNHLCIKPYVPIIISGQ